jgi:hypothetical protein
MEYTNPLLYRKALDTIEKIYAESMYNENIDLFRIKDLLDSISSGQIECKKWVIEKLKPFITEEYDACLIIGGWYGLMSHMLSEAGFDRQIINYELDEVCNKMAKKIRIHDNIIFKDQDGLELFHDKDANNEVKIVICTACEHIDQTEIDFTFRLKDKNMLMCLQSNNYFDVDSHINCKKSLEEFVDSLPLNEILYKGKRNINDEYERYMVIGK